MREREVYVGNVRYLEKVEEKKKKEVGMSVFSLDGGRGTRARTFWMGIRLFCLGLGRGMVEL